MTLSGNKPSGYGAGKPLADHAPAHDAWRLAPTRNWARVLRLRARHGIWLLLAFLLCLSIGALSGETDLSPTAAALLKWTPVILRGFALNILMSVIAMAIGTVGGFVLGIAQISHRTVIRRGSWLFTEFFRNAPWLVLLFYCMFLLPFQVKIGSAIIPVPDWVKATFGLALSVAGNVSEIVRGGLQSIPSTQWEAAESMAFSRRVILWQIIIPQCVKRMLPPWMNLYALLIMATPLASIVGVNDAMTMTQAAITAEGRHELVGPMYLYLMCLFFVYSYPITWWTDRLERRYVVMM
jgi:polar amino acid transport system permease protein